MKSPKIEDDQHSSSNIVNPYQAPKFSSSLKNDIDINQVKFGQKIVIYAIVSNFFINFIIRSMDLYAFSMFLSLIVMAIGVFGIYKISTGLRYHIGIKILLIILMFIPLINLLMLIFLNSRATRALKDEGYDVGFFGVKK